jgi:sulfate-transporting ATPase
VLDQLFPSASATWLVVISGVFLILLALLHPDGIVSTQVRQLHALGSRVFRRRRSAVKAKPLPDLGLSRVEPRSLEIFDVVVRYGGVTAIDGARLKVEPGEIVGLIGPNGAGKTTLIDTVTGFNRPAAGEVSLGGERIDHWSVHRRSRGGLSRSFQSLELFESSTVRENLSVASDSASRSVYATDLVVPRGETLSPAAIAAVRELDLEGHLDERVSDLPYGRRRLVAIARAIATTPSVLLLDEPAAGLSSGETQELAAILRRLADAWGFGILVVEHDMAFVMGLCDKVVVLDFGRQIAYGTPEEVQRDPAVIAAYLGDQSDSAPADKSDKRRQVTAAPIPGEA